MGKIAKYHSSGFIPIGEPPARRSMTAAAVTITKGQYLIDDGSGYATNTAVATIDECLGIAAGDCASGGTVEYYPIDEVTQYVVPVAATSVVTQSSVGTVCDLEAAGTIDEADNTADATGPLFFIDEIDISAEALAVNTLGYAIGHFVWSS